MKNKRMVNGELSMVNEENNSQLSTVNYQLKKGVTLSLPKGYKNTEIGVIPEEWEVVLIGDLFDFKNGLNKEKEFFGYGTPIVNYMDVYNKRGIINRTLSGRHDPARSTYFDYAQHKG